MTTDMIIETGAALTAPPPQGIAQSFNLATGDVMELVAFDNPSHNPAVAYIAGLSSAGSRRKMTEALNEIARLVAGDAADHKNLNWYAFRLQHANAARAYLSESYAASTANWKLSALRGALNMAVSLLSQIAPDDPAKALQLVLAKDAIRSTIEGIEHIKGGTPDDAAGRTLKPTEIKALLEACNADDSIAGDRDAAILAIAYAGGLRRSEIAALDVKDFDPDGHKLTVHGKRNKVRTVYVPSAGDALDDWLTVRGRHSGPLFNRILKGGHMVDRGMTDQAIYTIMLSRAEEAKVKEFTPHDIRRTFAGDMLDAGVDIATVQKIMGHSDPKTTAGYDRRGERAKQKAGGTLTVPWVRRRG